jgi:hypothetical protein
MADDSEGDDTKSRNAKRAAVLGVVFVLIPWGLSLIGVTVNLLLGGALLAVAFVLLVYAFWIWEKASRFHLLLRLLTIIVAAILYFALIGKQMLSEYQRQHPAVHVGPNTGESTTIEVSLVCNSDTLPIKIPVGGVAYVLPFNKARSVLTKQIFMPMFNTGNIPMLWPDPDLVEAEKEKQNMGVFITRCDVMNHGDRNLFDLVVPFENRYDLSSNKFFPTPVLINPLDKGKSLPIYLVNDCPIEIQAHIPKNGTAKLPGDREIYHFEFARPHKGEEYNQLNASGHNWTQISCD